MAQLNTDFGQLKLKKTGFSLVEVILASALSGMLVLAFVSTLLYGQEASALNGKRMRALSLAEEGLEATRNIRDENFSNLVDGVYGVAVTGTSWGFSVGSSTIGNFTRTINISSVDSNTKRVSSTVAWQQNASRTGTAVLSQLLTNWQALTIGNWGSPIIDSVFDLTSANSGHATANGIAVAIQGNFLYLGRANSAGREFYIFDISNPSTPTLLGQRVLNGDLNSIAIAGNYAYIASSDNSSELQIVDISNPATISSAGKLTVVDLTVANSGNNNVDAKAVYIQGGYLYMVRDGGLGFLIFDLSNPADPGDPIGSAIISGTPNNLVVVGNYAYVASTDNTAELQIFNITNKTAPVLAKSFDLNSGNDGANALSIAYQGNYLFMGRASSAAPEFYSINITDPLNPSVASTLEIGADVVSISYDDNSRYAFIATADTANDFQVIDVSTPASLPLALGKLNIGNSPQQLIYSSSLNRVFVASSINTEELEVIKSQ